MLIGCTLCRARIVSRLGRANHHWIFFLLFGSVEAGGNEGKEILYRNGQAFFSEVVT